MSKSILALAVVGLLTATGLGHAQVHQYNHSSQSQSSEGMSVEDAIAKKMIKANEAEIELAQMAMRKTDNEEIKQLTQTMVTDHQKLNEKIKKHCDMKDSGSANRRTSQTQTTQGQLEQTQTSMPNQKSTQGMRTLKAQPSGAGASETVPAQLCAISDQACDNALKMTKEMLSEYDGEEFEMAFLGQQCVAHTMMLAELKAIESEGPQELRELCSKAIPTVKNHLQEIKTLASKLGNDNSSR